MKNSGTLSAYEAEIKKGYTSHQALNRVAMRSKGNAKKRPKASSY